MNAPQQAYFTIRYDLYNQSKLYNSVKSGQIKHRRHPLSAAGLFMGIQIANVWHFGLRLTNTAFKPAFGQLYKKHPVYTKICLFEIQNRIFFLTRGAQPDSSDSSPSGEGTPLPTLYPLGAFGASFPIC